MISVANKKAAKGATNTQSSHARSQHYHSKKKKKKQERPQQSYQVILLKWIRCVYLVIRLESSIPRHHAHISTVLSCFVKLKVKPMILSTMA